MRTLSFLFFLSALLVGQADRQIEVCSELNSTSEYIQVYNPDGVGVATLTKGCATVGEFSVAGGSAVFFRRQVVGEVEVDVPLDRTNIRPSLVGVSKVKFYIDRQSSVFASYE